MANELIYTPKATSINGKLVCGDAIEFLKSLPRDSARVVFLDPPFNLGKRYDRKKNLDRKPGDEYEKWLENVADEAIRVLEPGGSLFLYHVPLWAMRLGAYLKEGASRLQNSDCLV